MRCPFLEDSEVVKQGNILVNRKYSVILITRYIYVQIQFSQDFKQPIGKLKIIKGPNISRNIVYSSLQKHLNPS